MLNDVMSLIVALYAVKLATKPSCKPAFAEVERGLLPRQY